MQNNHRHNNNFNKSKLSIYDILLSFKMLKAILVLYSNK